MGFRVIRPHPGGTHYDRRHAGRPLRQKASSHRWTLLVYDWFATRRSFSLCSHADRESHSRRHRSGSSRTSWARFATTARQLPTTVDVLHVTLGTSRGSGHGVGARRRWWPHWVSRMACPVCCDDSVWCDLPLCSSDLSPSLRFLRACRSEHCLPYAGCNLNGVRRRAGY